MFNVKTNIPTFIYVTTGSVNDVKGPDYFPLEARSYYLMDKGYIDFGRLYRIHKQDAFFVIRAKDNLKFIRRSSRKVDEAIGVICDQTINLKKL